MAKAVDSNPTTDIGKLTPPWQQATLALVLLLGWILFLYRDTGIAMATIWYRSETFTHGFLVPPIVLWLVWRQRCAIAAISPRPMLGALVLVAGVAFTWLLADLVAVNALTQFAFVALLVLAVPSVLGLAVTRLIIFPLGFMFFCVPVGEFLLPQLMEWTANFTVLALRLSGIPVYREGLQFVIPSGNWSVVEACSGVRYLIASLTVGTLFAYLNYQSTKKRLLFVLVSILVPVLANWLRAYMIVMLGHLSGNKLGAGVDHLIYGWVFFGIVIMLMFIVGARWAEPEGPVGALVLPAFHKMLPFSIAKLWLVALGYAMLLGMPHLATWAIHKTESTAPVSFKPPTVLAADWQADISSQANIFKPAFQNPSAELNATYSSQGRSAGLYLGFYRHQDYDRKLVSSNNVLVTSNDTKWSQVSRSTRELYLDSKPVAIRSAELRAASLAASSSEGRLVVGQIYWINGTLTSSDYLAKVYSALYRLTGQGNDSAVIIVYAAKDQAAGGELLMESFLSSNYPAIDELLLKAQRGK
jgi:exosortase A